ncbi:villin-1 isoform X2 [Gouania willdenowi]|uniref:villin-1 isoform X2 n=1 Tax=Gouania willdenowi TaxID=441366 RepID=UPI001056CE66|nr:villin-like protein isoform X2 [Gouania willdenowi]
MESRIGSTNEKRWSKETTRPSLRQTHHKFSRNMSDDTQDSFRNVNKKPGLQIWTINKMQMVPVQAQCFGNFFEGDCYIVMCIGEKKGTRQSADIHYWIGKHSSQDEQGSAAIYVTQLDEYLGGTPVQHREVQGNESPRFRSYFKNGLIYKKGGVASGFQHVDTNVYNILRLLHVKGRKCVTATEVEVSWNSFNKGDIFLLDMGKAIVQWNGPQSNRREKLKAVMLAQDIRDRERGGRAKIGVVEGNNERDSPELMKVMTKVLGPKPGQLREATSDEESDLVQKNNVRLYHVFQNSGNLVVQEVATQPLTQDLLLSSDCYIVDKNGSSVMVWKGKQSSKEERREAMNRAVGYIKAKNYPTSTRVEVMTEGGESAMFKHLFKSWKDKDQTHGLGTTYSVGKIAKVDQVKFDVMELHAHPQLAAQKRMVDDASGDVKVWRIEHVELVEVNPATYGQFYGGDCYLVLYTYQRAGQQRYILYMWQGRHSTANEITACAYQAVNIDNQFNGAPVQVRVVMGKEPLHFLAIFKGKLIIFEGGTGRPSVVNPDPGARLFQVRGTSELNTKATEVIARASSLNTNDVFLLKTDHMCFLWYGKGCSGDEREMGKAISEVLSKQDKRVVMEGQEPAEFWVALGGKAPYASDKRLEREEPPHSPRLFECSNQTGRFRMTEVDDFAQIDLDEEDVMMLDTWEEIFLWIGNMANQNETKEALSSSQEYLKTHPASRDPDTPIIFVKQGHEPPNFTGWFNAWDPHKWSDLNDTHLDSGPVGKGWGGYGAPGGPISAFLAYRAQGGDLSPTSSTPTSPPMQRPEFSSSSSFSPTPAAGNSGMNVEPKGFIIKSTSELPEGVDPSQREEHLSDQDFENLLGTSRADFLRLPKWRQNDLKKKAGIF